jgi:hypothetical protein
MSVNFIQSLVGEIGDFYEWAQEQLSRERALEQVLTDLGLPANTPTDREFPQSALDGVNQYRKSFNPNDAAALSVAEDLTRLLGIPFSSAAKLTLPRNNLDGIKKFRDSDDPDFDQFKSALNDLKAIVQAFRQYVGALGVSGQLSVDDATARLLEVLSLNYMRLRWPAVYWWAQPFGFIQEPLAGYDGGKSQLRRIGSFFRDFRGYLGLNKIETEQQAKEFSDTFFIPLAVAVTFFLDSVRTLSESQSESGTIRRIVTNTVYGWEASPGSATPRADEVSNRALSFQVLRRKIDPTGAITHEIENSLAATFLLVPKIHGGPALFISIGGDTKFEMKIDETWRLRFDMGVGRLADFLLHFGKLSGAGANLPTGSSDPRVSLSLVAAGKDERPFFVLGSEKGIHLALGRFSFTSELFGPDAGLKAETKESALVLDIRKYADGFLTKILPSDPPRIPLNFSVGYSTARGFFFDDGTGFFAKPKTKQPAPAPTPAMVRAGRRDVAGGPVEQPNEGEMRRVTPVAKSVGGVRIQHLLLRLTPKGDDENAVLEFEASAGIDVKLGPALASIDRVGFQLALDFARKEKNLGFVDLSFGFKPPAGIGLAIDSAVVRGGGFLYFDNEKAQYAGVVHLELESGLTLKALGLLTTRMPDGGRGFSLLVIITAEGFKPIPIGFGFMLTGIGGLLGINRTFNAEALQAGVKNRTLDAVLFPKDPVRNASQYLSALNTVFPPAENHFIFGPMAQLTWGTPPLLTINLALALEFGARLRLAVMGQVSAILPKKENDLVRLQADAVGIIDFDRKTAAFDAALYDSRLAKKFVITGQMAMRMSWGDSPSFALAVGGFHPSFKPPAGFPALERVAISLASEENLRLRCEAYFALTSNTVQFGARAELYARAAGFSVEGSLGFNVLVQFDPFHFIADFHVSLQLKRGSRNLFKVKVEGEIAGPRPLHVRGKASFEIFWVDISFRFERTLISGERPPLPEPVDVGPMLRAALAERANWTATLGAAEQKMVSLREGARGGELTIHPLSRLSVRQNVVPLNVDIARFGNARPSGERRFEVSKAFVNDVEQGIEPVSDHFAPAQFFDLTDDDKLTRPSFEKMRAGLQLGSDKPAFGAPLTTAMDYEEIIVDPLKNESVRSAEPFKLNAIRLAQTLHLSAVGRSELRRAGTSKYSAAGIELKLDDRLYALASIDDLSVAGPADANLTYTEAWDRLRRKAPGAAKTLQIVSK